MPYSPIFVFNSDVLQKYNFFNYRQTFFVFFYKSRIRIRFYFVAKVKQIFET